MKDKLATSKDTRTWGYDRLPSNELSILDESNYSIADKIREQNEYNTLLENENSSVEAAIELSKRRAQSHEDFIPKLTEINDAYEKQHQLESQDSYNATIKERNNEYNKYLSNLNEEVSESEKVQDAIQNISSDSLEELGYRQKGYLDEIRDGQQEFEDSISRIETLPVDNILPKKEEFTKYYDEILADQEEFQNQLNAIETSPIGNLVNYDLSEQTDGQMTLNTAAMEYNNTLSEQNMLSNQRSLALVEETDGQIALTVAEETSAENRERDTKKISEQLAAKYAVIEASNKELLANVNQKLAVLGVTDAEKELTVEKLKKISLSNSEGAALAKETLQTLGLGEATKKTSLALKGLRLAGSMFASWAFSKVLEIVVKAIDETIVTTEEYREKLSNLKSETSNIEKDLSSMNDELKTTGDRIKELEGKGSLSFTEKSELENLKQQNAELDRTIKLLELEQKAKNKEKNKAFIDTMNSDVQDNSEYTSSSQGGEIFKGNNAVFSLSGILYDPQTEENYINQQFEKRKKLLDDKSKAETKEEQDRIQEQIDEIDSYLTGKSSQWAQDATGIDYVKNPTDEDDRKVNEWLDYIKNFQDKMMIAMSDGEDRSDAQANAFTRLIDNWQFDDTVQGLQDLGNQGKVTADMLDDPKYNDFINALVEIGVIDSADNLDDVALAFNNLSDSANDSAGSINNAIASFDSDSFFEKVNAIQSGYDKLLSAQEEFNTYGAITSATLKDLMDNNLLQYMTISANGVDINTAALEQNEQALKNTATAELYNAMCNDIQNLSLDDTSQLSSIAQTAIANLDGAATTAGKNASIAAQGWWEYGASIESIPGVSDLVGNKKKQAEAIVNTYQKIAKQINSISVGKTNSSKKKSGSSSKGSGSSSSTDPIKEQFETEYNLLKHNLEMEYITEKDYYNGVQALNDKYFKGKEKYLDEYRKYEEEVYKGLKSYYKDYVDKQMDYYEKALDANRITFNMYSSAVKTMLDNMWKSGKLSAEDYWSYVEKMLNKQKDIMDRVLSAITNRIQEEIDKYQAHVDALEAENDKLEKRKDYLDSARAAAIKALEDEKDAKQAEKDALQDQIDALNDAADAEDLILRKEKALYALRRAEEQRTVKTYVDGHGYIYRQDSDTLQDAKKDLKDIENEEIINKLKKQQDALQETIDKIQENIDWWNDLADLWQDKENDRIATELWGSNYRERILSGDVTITSDFAKEYLAIQDKINDNEQTIESTKEKIEWLDNLKDQYSSVTELYEQERDKQYADQVLGAGWEAEVLSGRLTTLDNFKKEYENLQKAIADAAEESAKRQILAAEAAQRAQAPSSGGGSNNGGGSGGGNSGGSGGGNSGSSTSSKKHVIKDENSGSTLHTSSTASDANSWINSNGYYTVSSYENTTTVTYEVAKKKTEKKKTYIGDVYKTSGEASSKIGMLGGVGYDKVKGGYQVYKYAKGTNNARKGLAKVSEKEYGDELVISNDGTVTIPHGEQLYDFDGGEKVIPANETKEILKNQGNVTRLPDGRELLADGSVKFPDGTMLTPVANPLENLAQPDLAKAMANLQLPRYQQRPMDYGNVTKTEVIDQSVSIGEIHVHEMQNVDQFAKEIVMKFPQKVLQEMHRRK